MLPLHKAMETSTGSTRCAPDLPCNFGGRTWREKTYHTARAWGCAATVGSSDQHYIEIAEAKASVAGWCSTRPSATTQSCTWPFGKNKLIRKHLRQNMRRRRNARASQILAESKDLGRLDSAHIAPIRRIETASLGPTPNTFRGCLGNIFMSDIGHETATLASLDDSDCLGLVPPFTLQELGAVMRVYSMARQQTQMAWSRKYLNTATFLCKHACWIFTIRWLQVGLSKCRGNINCSQCCRSLAIAPNQPIGDPLQC